MAKFSLSLLFFLIFYSISVLAAPLLNSLVESVSKTADAVGDALKNVTSSVTDPISAPYSLRDGNPTARSAAVLLKQTTFLYGPPVGGGPYFPTGPLGLAKVVADQALTGLELAPQFALTSFDAFDSTLGAPQYNGLKRLDDYLLLYQDQLRRSIPSDRN
jgi:hypothetical protein